MRQRLNASKRMDKGKARKPYEFGVKVRMWIKPILIWKLFTGAGSKP